MRLNVFNNHVVVNGDSSEIEDLKNLLSFKIKGSEFSSLYKRKLWDGKARFLKIIRNKNTGKNEFTFATGLLNYVISNYDWIDVNDNRKFDLKFDWNHIKNIPLRKTKEVSGYKGIEKAIEHKIGIWHCATNFGKTRMGIALLKLISFSNNVPTTIFTHSELIHSQIYDELVKYCGDKKIGVIKRGVYNPNLITVCMMPTVINLVKNKDKNTIEFLKSIKGYITEECFIEGTKIKTINGDVNIENIKIGDKIFNKNGIGAVTHVFRKNVKVDNLITLKLSNKKIITTTKTHRFFVDNEWIEAQYLNKKSITTYGENYEKKIRVEDIEVYKQGSNDRYGQSKNYNTKTVYDLEISNHPSYFANNILVHNCHRTSSATFLIPLNFCVNSEIRIGMSGTPLYKDVINNLKLMEKTGDVIYEVRNKTLIDNKISAKPKIIIRKIDGQYKFPPEYFKWPLNQKRYKYAVDKWIVDNKILNEKICGLCVKKVEKGQDCLIIVSRILHAKNIIDMLKAKNKKVLYLDGKIKHEDRKKVLDKFRKSGGKILISSPVIEEGVDIDNIRHLFLASGGKSIRMILQRIGRSLRKKKKGENMTTIYDFAIEDELITIKAKNKNENDISKRYLHDHYKERLKIYKSEKFEVVEK